MTSDPSDYDVANAVLQHALMEETRSYLERGRALKGHTDEEVLDICVVTVERWFHDRVDQNQRDMDDAAAEIRLRGLESPEDRLKPMTDKMREEILRDPRGLTERAMRQIQDFIDARDNPQN